MAFTDKALSLAAAVGLFISGRGSVHMQDASKEGKAAFDELRNQVALSDGKYFLQEEKQGGFTIHAGKDKALMDLHKLRKDSPKIARAMEECFDKSMNTSAADGEVIYGLVGTAIAGLVKSIRRQSKTPER